MPVMWCGVVIFHMPLELVLHGQDVFDYIKDILAAEPYNINKAKDPAYEIEDKGTYFQLVRTRTNQGYQNKG